MISYVAAVECCDLKLAHYYGYLLGNELLYYCIPGYHPNMALDFNYTRMMEQYFGRKLSMEQWEGCFFVKEWKAASIPEEKPQDVLTLREKIRKDASV